jgi:hypothetical protein
MRNRVCKSGREKASPRIPDQTGHFYSLLILKLMRSLRKCFSDILLTQKKEGHIYALNFILHLSTITLWRFTFSVLSVCICTNSEHIPMIACPAVSVKPRAGQEAFSTWLRWKSVMFHLHQLGQNLWGTGYSRCGWTKS